MTEQRGRISRWAAAAKSKWPGVTVTGSGRFASVAHCHAPRVTLHATRAEAGEATRQLDTATCGHACTGDHELVDLLEPANTAKG